MFGNVADKRLVMRRKRDGFGYCSVNCFFFQAEDGIRDAQESRGLGDVYKRQILWQSQL